MSSPAANGNAASGTVPQLISQLRSAFQPREFDRVQQILSDREEAMNGEIARCKREYEAMEKQHGEMALEKLMADDELNKCRRERDLLRDQVARAEENQRVQIARLEEDQRVRMARFKEDQRVIGEREKNSDERYAKLLEEYTKVETENRTLSFTITTLEFEKMKAEGELEETRRRFEELNERVSRLEDDTAMLMSRGGRARVEQRREAVEEAAAAAAAEGPFVAEELMIDGKEAADSLAGGGSAPDSMEAESNHGDAGSRVIIEVNDSDDDMPIRKRGLWNDDDNDVKPNIKRRAKSLQEMIKDGIVGSKSSDTGDTSSSGSDLDIDSEIAKLQRRISDKKTWAVKVDMISALQREPELCMNAVCALYRQQLCKDKPVSGSLLRKNRGFNKLDSSRGASMGRYLTDDDPQGKMKRSVSELQKFDPIGLIDCKNLSLRYADQLFEIYRNKEDPYFLPL